MTTQQVSTRIQTHEMVLVHRALRREFSLLPLMIDAAPSGERHQINAVEAHAREMLAVLHHHHAGEDDLLWPKLRERAPLDAALLQRMQSQHDQLGALLELAGPRLTAWAAAPGASATSELAGLFREISLHLNVHLTDEQEQALPLAAVHLRQEEWNALGRRGMASLPKSRSLVFLGHILEEASAEEARSFLGHVPPPVRMLYRLIGRPRFHREVRQLRAGIRND